MKMRLILSITFTTALLLTLAKPTAGITPPQWIRIRSISMGEGIQMQYKKWKNTTIGEEEVKSFSNSCQCECCYQVGEHSECVSPTYTMFDVPTCEDCNVATCADQYPISCDEPTSEVNTTCIIRKGWLIRLIPLSFIVIFIVLLGYGCFIKKYDGYNPVTKQTSMSSSVAPTPRHPSYLSTPFGNSPTAG